MIGSVANAEIISKDGVVTDTVTGLMWQNNSDVANAQKYWMDAKQYCEVLQLNNYHDWRLPNIYELVTILDTQQKTSPKVISEMLKITENAYWSVSYDNTNDGKPFGVQFRDGTVRSFSPNFTANAICARGSEINYESLNTLYKKKFLKISDDILERIEPMEREAKIEKAKVAFEKKYEEDKLEKNAYELASKQNTIHAYKSFLYMYPNGNYVAKAQKNIEFISYNEASSTNTIASYNAYLKQYPNGEYASFVRSNIEELAQRRREQAEKASYEKASSQNTIAAYKAYLKQYPNGANASSAKQNIYELSPAGIAQRKKEAKERQDREAREAREQAERDKRACQNLYVGKPVTVYIGNNFWGRRIYCNSKIIGVGSVNASAEIVRNSENHPMCHTGKIVEQGCHEF